MNFSPVFGIADHVLQGALCFALVLHNEHKRPANSNPVYPPPDLRRRSKQVTGSPWTCGFCCCIRRWTHFRVHMSRPGSAVTGLAALILAPAIIVIYRAERARLLTTFTRPSWGPSLTAGLPGGCLCDLKHRRYFAPRRFHAGAEKLPNEKENLPSP